MHLAVVFFLCWLLQCYFCLDLFLQDANTQRNWMCPWNHNEFLSTLMGNMKISPLKKHILSHLVGQFRREWMEWPKSCCPKIPSCPNRCTNQWDLCKYYDKENGKICICVFVMVLASQSCCYFRHRCHHHRRRRPDRSRCGRHYSCVAKIHSGLCIMLCFDILNGKFMRNL